MITKFNNYDILNQLSVYKITANPFNEVIVYIENNEILGFLDYSVMYERAEINYIFVREQYRCNGIASKLLDYMFSNIDVNETTLEVNITNINAIKLYKKMGFKEVNIRKGYYDGVDGILMLRGR